MEMSSEKYDVAVIGGGPGGFGAAVAAGRMDQRVTLIEAHDILGGAGTTALVNNFCNAYWDGNRFIIGGIFSEIRNRLIGRKAMWTTRGPNTEDKVGQEFYDPDQYADELEIMCRQADVDLQLSRRCIGASFENERTVLELDDGESIESRTIVDATGDAMLANQAGVPTTMGRGDEGKVQPLTYCYMFGPVDLEKLGDAFPSAIQYDENIGTKYGAPSYVEEVCEMVRRDVESGKLDIPVPTLYGTMSVPGREKNMTTNFNHMVVDDPTNPDELERATEEGKRQMREGIRWFRENLPGFEEVEVIEHPRQIGVRESRQIHGLYRLDSEDIIRRRQFDDVIAQCCFNIDIHPNDLDRQERIEGGRIGEEEHYDIPWRSLIPKDGPSNLVVAGRCISATSEAMASFRVSPSVMAIGEAAGVTAVMAAEKDCPMRSVDSSVVQKRLRETGGILF